MLTLQSRYSYTGSLKTITPAFTPRQRVFFMPFLAWTRAENNQYQPKHCVIAFSESTPLLILNGEFLRKITQMTNAISIFKFNQNQIRTQVINGEPWFCLVDCRAALSIKGSLKKVSLSEKGVTICHSLTKGGKQELNFINEPNLYRLIFRSNKPQAQAFADWVYSEVLPSIRRTGTYGTAPASKAIPKRTATSGVYEKIGGEYAQKITLTLALAGFYSRHADLQREADNLRHQLSQCTKAIDATLSDIKKLEEALQ